MSRVSTEQLESFINDNLKEDLKVLEQHINKYNAEIMEHVQLKNTIETLQNNMDLSTGFKTQMHIGGNVFMEAKVEQLDNMLVDVGKGYFLQLTLPEALKYAEQKIKILTRECDVLREESVKKRSEIKLALMCIAEQEKLHLDAKELRYQL